MSTASQRARRSRAVVRFVAWLGVVAAVACVEPKTRSCPTVDCPYDEVCDGRGGCAKPDALEVCAGVADGEACSYEEVPTGECAGGLCVPVGCGNDVMTSDEVCDDGNTVNGDGCSADCRSNETCGNGITDPAAEEQCDDGNTVDGDGCQGGCINPRCGDGVRDVSLNEACDEGEDNSEEPDAACRLDCQLPRCGDEVIDTGEVCDDGNLVSGDGCSADCLSDETCGNGYVDFAADEECDSPDRNACREGCTLTRCGDGVLDELEECDLGQGNANEPGAACRLNCQRPRCGDDVADGDEVCDDGNLVGDDGCSADCLSDETCGNGYVDFALGEECDDPGNPTCRSNCILTRCGDGIVDALEECDLGESNSQAADAACRLNCEQARCGDGVLDTGETCDDGNTRGADGCSPDCRSLETCGNGYVDFAVDEECDSTDRTACRADCTLTRCGDGVIDTLEQCDLGAANSNDPDAPCRRNCQLPRCGDGVEDTAEVCDDGNTLGDDGCSPDCQSLETCGNGYVDFATGEECDETGSPTCRSNCTLTRCGDGILDPLEECDELDANADVADAPCRTNCQLPRCGDGVPDTEETCDDGNTRSGDGCSPDCESLEVCGNGYLDLANDEQCDAGADNADAGGAPCRLDCTLPVCGDGYVDAFEQCDLGDENSDAANAACRTNCLLPRCGDGARDTSRFEACDDGNLVGGDGCSGDCRSNETCGNAFTDPDEACDDGNLVNRDLCHNDCTLPTCGDGVVDFFEQCDDDNSNDLDGCRNTCVFPRCGDAIVDAAYGEVCDDGNLVAQDGCTPDCRSNETCGNGVVDVAVEETCDDGNTSARDGCSACKVETAVVLTPGLTPARRRNAQLAYDAARQRVVLFGGLAASALNDTWEWDGRGWTQRKPLASPSARHSGAMTYDPVRRRVVLFGGLGNGGFRNDTWEWDGVTWTRTIPATSPGARADTAMAYDARLGGVLLHGGRTRVAGSDADVLFSDTWLWQAGAWTPLAFSGVPSGRSGHAMVYDAARDETVLWGGLNAPNRTYAWDVVTSTWVDRGPGPSIEVFNRPAMAYDPSLQRVVLVGIGGNQSWEWNGSSWVPFASASPPNHAETAAVYDAARAEVVRFSGAPGDGDTWLRTGRVWTLGRTRVSPSPRFGAAIGYDPLRGRVVLFGGLTEGPYGPPADDTWEWDGRSWAKIEDTDKPLPSSGAWMDYDTASRRLVRFGGRQLGGAGQSVWSYDGKWLAVPGSAPPVSHVNVGMAYHRSLGALLAFGGKDAGEETWAWDGSRWLTYPADGAPPPRKNHAMAYDPVRDVTVLYGGRANTDRVWGDLWEFDGGRWFQFEAPGPGERYGTSLVYNPDARRISLFGNAPDGIEDLWEWSGRWTPRLLDTQLQARYRSAVAYDAARHQFVVFGGRDGLGDVEAVTRVIEYRPNEAVESCAYASDDYDRDGLFGCEDPDCWSVCAPLCPPGATAGCALDTLTCGDGVCEPFETCELCPGDCGVCAGGVCGDYVCNSTSGETASTCRFDCAP